MGIMWLLPLAPHAELFNMSIEHFFLSQVMADEWEGAESDCPNHPNGESATPRIDANGESATLRIDANWESNFGYEYPCD